MLEDFTVFSIQRQHILPKRFDALFIYFHQKRDEFQKDHTYMLSTCDRIDIGFIDRDDSYQEYFDMLQSVITKEECCAMSIYREKDALKYLIGLSAGMYSTITGETQITGQVKEVTHHLRGEMQKIFQQVNKYAAMIRHETGLSQGRVSLYTHSLHLIKNIWETNAKIFTYRNR